MQSTGWKPIPLLDCRWSDTRVSRTSSPVARLSKARHVDSSILFENRIQRERDFANSLWPDRDARWKTGTDRATLGTQPDLGGSGLVASQIWKVGGRHLLSRLPRASRDECVCDAGLCAQRQCDSVCDRNRSVQGARRNCETAEVVRHRRAREQCSHHRSSSRTSGMGKTPVGLAWPTLHPADAPRRFGFPVRCILESQMPVRHLGALNQRRNSERISPGKDIRMP